MTIQITPERPDSPDASQLIDELEAVLAPAYPAASRHGYSVKKLIAQGVAFFVLRADGLPAGCGGVQIFGREYAELKRMYVRPRFRGRGFARLLISHLAEYARAQGVPVLRLETGIFQREAIRLYESAGFTYIPPFGAYSFDPLSVYFGKKL